MEFALPRESSGGKSCRSPKSRGPRCRIIHRRGIHPTSLFLFYSIWDARRRNNSVAGSLSPDSCRVRRMPTTAALGQELPNALHKSFGKLFVWLDANSLEVTLHQ